MLRFTRHLVELIICICLSSSPSILFCLVFFSRLRRIKTLSCSCFGEEEAGLLRLLGTAAVVRLDNPGITAVVLTRGRGQKTAATRRVGGDSSDARSSLRSPLSATPPTFRVLWMGGKQSTAGRPRGGFPGVSTDDSAVPPSAHFGHYRPSGTMGFRSRSVSSVAGIGIEHSPAVPFGFYTPRGTASDRAGGGSGTNAAHGNGYQETVGGHHTDGMLYLGSRGSLADTLPLHIAPRWFSGHSGKCQHTDPLHVSVTPS